MIDGIYSEMADASERSNMGPKTSNFLVPEKTDSTYSVRAVSNEDSL